MPIPIDKLKAAQPPLGERILQFLKSRQDQAFNITEVWAGVEGYDDDGIALILMAQDAKARILKSYQEALSPLVAEGKVSAADYQGIKYFGYAGG